MLQKHMKFNACGSGIGLSISKMIIESLGGKISVASEEGEWTEFTFNVKITENIYQNYYEEAQLSGFIENVSYLYLYSFFCIYTPLFVFILLLF